MNKKDLIDIYDVDGNITKMELVLKFELNNMNYIIYRTMDNKEYFAAKYQKGINIDFNSDLSDEELKICNKIYEEISNDKKRFKS